MKQRWHAHGQQGGTHRCLAQVHDVRTVRVGPVYLPALVTSTSYRLPLQTDLGPNVA